MLPGKNYWQKVAVALMLLLPIFPTTLFADEFSPALLEITEQDGGWVDVIWKVPTRGEQALPLAPILPDFLQPIGPGSGRAIPGAWLKSSSYSTGGQSLTGATLQIDGLVGVPTDVLVRITLQDGAQHSAILRGGNNSFVIPEQVTRLELAVSYWQMGTIHILEGFDHLLFLLTLLLIVTGIWPLPRPSSR